MVAGVDRVTQVANFFVTELTETMGPESLTATVATTVGGPSSPCILAIEPDVPDRVEYILFDGTFTGTTFVTTTLGNRYLEGSAAGSGIVHPAGSMVTQVLTGQHIADLNARIDPARTHAAIDDGNPHGTSHAQLSGVTADQHHAEDHAARHATGGADVVSPASIGAAPTPHDNAHHDPNFATAADLGSHEADEAEGVHGATISNTANKIVRRNADGRFNVSDPTSAAHAATKGYVDGGVAFQLIHNDSPDSPSLGASPTNINSPPVSVTLPSGWNSMRLLVGGFIGWYTQGTTDHVRASLWVEIPDGTQVGVSRIDSRDPATSGEARHGAVPMDAAPAGTFSANTTLRLKGERTAGPATAVIFRRYIYVLKFRAS